MQGESRKGKILARSGRPVPASIKIIPCCKTFLRLQNDLDSNKIEVLQRFDQDFNESTGASTNSPGLQRGLHSTTACSTSKNQIKETSLHNKGWS